MGYNKIVFIRNDMMNEIEAAPLSVVERICHYGGDFYYPIDRYGLGQEQSEPVIHSQAMTVFPEHHASETVVYVLSGNTCKEVISPKVKTINGEKFYLIPVDFGNERKAE